VPFGIQSRSRNVRSPPLWGVCQIWVVEKKPWQAIQEAFGFYRRLSRRLIALRYSMSDLAMSLNNPLAPISVILGSWETSRNNNPRRRLSFQSCDELAHIPCPHPCLLALLPICLNFIHLVTPLSCISLLPVAHYPFCRLNIEYVNAF